jgi:signal peptidase II
MATKKSSSSKPIISAGSSGGGKLLPWLGIATIVLLLDQLSKITITKMMTFEQVIYVASNFNLRFTFNPGAAWGFLANQSGWQRHFFTVLGIGAAVFIIVMLKKNSGQRLFCWAMSLILGGAIGNVIDRIVYGKVVDFLDVHAFGWHWPTFNIADAAICIGAGLFILDEFRRVNK